MKYKVKELPTIKDVEKIFFVGIKGVGVAPLALIARDAGITVAGSDIDEEFITDVYLAKSKITITKGFGVEEVAAFFGDFDISKCLIVTTGAHKGFDNPQVMWAKNQGIAILTQGQALAQFMEGYIIAKEHMRGIAIAGSHGKTTISSLLATTLKASGYDPTYSVGTGEVFPLGAPGYLGRGELFVAEADEYSSEPQHDKVPKFLYQNPNYAIFNNIDFDHPDLFENVDDVVEAFLQLAGNIKSEGILFLNGDDKYLSKFKEKVDKDIRIVTYGENDSNDYTIKKIVNHGLGSIFTVLRHGKELGIFELKIPGSHNAKNALSVVAFMSEMGLEPKKLRIALKAFHGTKRRCEVVGHTENGALIIDDYGHHPLEIATTINAVKASYPSKKLVCIFQPHTFSRTKSLLEEFGKSFGGVHKLLLLPIFKSQRDTEKDTLTIEEYVGAHRRYSEAEFFDDFDHVVEYTKQNYDSPDFVIMTIGAGDIYKVALSLKKNG